MSSKKKAPEKALEQDSILQKLQDEHAAKMLEEGDSADVCVIFCGRKKSGKTSLIDRFVNPNKDASEQPKPTVALDYKFARHTTETSSSKTIAHIYDFGGLDSADTEQSKEMLKVPITAETISNMVLCITVDLSEPNSVIPSLLSWQEGLKAQVENALNAASATPAGVNKVRELREKFQAKWAEHADKDRIQGMPIPTAILGTKWDAFESNVDPEKRKQLCRALRFFAHVNGASLVCTSLKDKPSMNSMRNLLRLLFFGVAAKGSNIEQLEHNKALYIPAGHDSLAGIGNPQGSGVCTTNAWKASIESAFPYTTLGGAQQASMGGAEALGEELAKFSEAGVDGMVEQKIEELNQYRRQAERNQRLASEGIDVKQSRQLAA
jgi:dynein light intermediate chain 2